MSHPVCKFVITQVAQRIRAPQRHGRGGARASCARAAKGFITATVCVDPPFALGVAGAGLTESAAGRRDGVAATECAEGILAAAFTEGDAAGDFVHCDGVTDEGFAEVGVGCDACVTAMVLADGGVGCDGCESGVGAGEAMSDGRTAAGCAAIGSGGAPGTGGSAAGAPGSASDTLTTGEPTPLPGVATRSSKGASAHRESV